jgi:hypothetical protein
VVAVAVDTGRRENRGQAVQELESGKAEGGAARGIGLGEQVEDLVRAAADEVEAVEGKRPSGTIANESLQPVAVGSLDADAGVQAEPTAVLPAQHPSQRDATTC